MIGLIELVAIYVAATAVAYFLAVKLRHTLFGTVYAFIVQLGGAYSASFVVDMIRMAVAAEIPSRGVVIPCMAWSLWAVTAFAIAKRATAPRLVMAAPYALLAAVAATMSFMHVGNLITAAGTLVVGIAIYALVGPDCPARRAVA